MKASQVFTGSVLQDRSALFRHAIAIIATLALTAVSMAVDTRREIQLDNEKMQAIVDSLGDSIDKQIQAWRLALSAMSVSTALSYPYDISAFTKEARNFSKLTDMNMAFYRAEYDGLTLLSHTRVAEDELPKFFPKDQIPIFFETMQQVRQTGKAAVTNLFIGPIVGEYIASVIVSKSGVENSPELLSLNFSSHDISNILAKLKLPKDYIIGVVDRNGTIAARNIKEEEFVGKKIPDWYKDFISKNEYGFAEGVPVHGATFDRYRFVFRHLREADGWAVSLLVPPTAYPIVTVGSTTLIVGIASFIIANAIAWLFGSAQRQRIEFEAQYQKLTHRLLDELPGAVLRGTISRQGRFLVSLAFGRLSDYLVTGGVFRFEQKIIERIEEARKTPQDYVATEFDVKDQEKIFRVLIISSLQQNSYEIEYNLYILDITNQRSAEAAAINSTRLAALGQMAATLAHEMSQPINVISLAADNADYLLKENDIPGAEAKVKKIRDFSIKSRSLIDNLLSYARGDNQDRPLSPVSLANSIRLAADLTQAFLSRENIRLNYEIDKDVEIFARPIELENIFVNLIMNAYDAFRSRSSSGPRVITIRSEFDGDKIIVSVADTAGGISDDVMQKIFEPFVTTKKEGHGTGLGLAFVSGHVRAWGGDISVANVNNGAEFRLVFRMVPVAQVA